MQPSGYKLIEIETGNEVQSWGGTYGTLTDPPNPLLLPNGDVVCGAEVNGEYSGYRLELWMMDEPPPVVPAIITRRQCALQLLDMQYITPAEALAMTKAADLPAAIAAIFDQAVANGTMTEVQRTLAEIDFAAANYYRTNSLLGMMGLSEQQIDQFFIAASNL